MSAIMWLGRDTWLVSFLPIPSYTHPRQPRHNVVYKGLRPSQGPLTDVMMFGISRGTACQRKSPERWWNGKALGHAVSARAHSFIPLPFLSRILKETEPASKREPKYQWMSRQVGVKIGRRGFDKFHWPWTLSGTWKEPD